MILSKKRNFSEIINDTINFFKTNGVNYFKSYILILGGALLLMGLIFVVAFRDILGFLFTGGLSISSTYIESYFSNNLYFVISIIILFFIFFIFLSVVAYIYPVLYLKRIENGEKNIKISLIVNDFKQNIGKIFILFLGILFIVTPIFFILVSFSYLLVFILIGIPLLIIMVPTLYNIYFFLLYHYFSDKGNGFFASLSYAIRSQFGYIYHGNMSSPFWTYFGVTAIFIFISQIVQSGFSLLVPIFIAIIESVNNADYEIVILGLGGVIYFLIVIFSFLLGNVTSVASGLMYYDSRSDLHAQRNWSEIQNIGKKDEL